jgi:hypothetical protein
MEGAEEWDTSTHFRKISPKAQETENILFFSTKFTT